MVTYNRYKINVLKFVTIISVKKYIFEFRNVPFKMYTLIAQS